MLVLARKKNETIVINDEVVIQVLQIKGKTIRLGISAPNDVRIARGELKPLEIEVEASEGLSIVTDESENQDGNLKGKTEPERPVRATQGLSRFIKTNHQVGEDRPRTSYSGPMPISNRMESAKSNRLAVLTADDQYSQEVRESSTCYQATCEIELPVAQLRSNHN